MRGACYYMQFPRPTEYEEYATVMGGRDNERTACKPRTLPRRHVSLVLVMDGRSLWSTWGSVVVNVVVNMTTYGSLARHTPPISV